MHLYSYLDKLQQVALYTETGIGIFIQPTDGAALVETGDCLGAMTSELKPGECIFEFVSGGSKNYAYKTANTATGAESTVCKVRGFTMNYSSSQLVNLERIKHMILNVNETETVTVHTTRKIKRKRGKYGEGRLQIVTEPESYTGCPF
jgi:hypothetical protein